MILKLAFIINLSNEYQKAILWCLDLLVMVGKSYGLGHSYSPAPSNETSLNTTGGVINLHHCLTTINQSINHQSLLYRQVRFVQVLLYRQMQDGAEKLI